MAGVMVGMCCPKTKRYVLPHASGAEWRVHYVDGT